MESEDDQTAIGSGAEMMADSLAWPINKRILLVVINLIIMVAALAGAILSLVELKLLPENHLNVRFHSVAHYPRCQFPVLAPDGMERKGNCSKICPVDGRRSAVDDSLPQSGAVNWTNGGSAPAPEETQAAAAAAVVGGSAPPTYERLDYVIRYFLHCFLPKQSSYSRDHPASETVELPAYIAELLAVIAESLRFSIGTNTIGFFAASLGVCAAILRSSAALKISVALTFLDMIGQMGAAGFVFLAHDKTQNRNRYANFQLLMTSMCHMSSVCVQSAALALIGAVLSVAILAQVSSIAVASKIVSQNAGASQLAGGRLRRLAAGRGLAETVLYQPPVGSQCGLLDPVSYGLPHPRSFTAMGGGNYLNYPYLNGMDVNQQCPPFNAYPMNNGGHFLRPTSRDINIIS